MFPEFNHVKSLFERVKNDHELRQAQVLHAVMLLKFDSQMRGGSPNLEDSNVLAALSTLIGFAAEHVKLEKSDIAGVLRAIIAAMDDDLAETVEKVKTNLTGLSEKVGESADDVQISPELVDYLSQLGGKSRH